MNPSTRNVLLLVAITSLLVAGLLGIAVHENGGEATRTATVDARRQARARTTTTPAPTRPAAVPRTPGGDTAPDARRLAPVPPDSRPGSTTQETPPTTVAGTGLAQAGSGRVASGQRDLAATGGVPTYAAGLLLLALAAWVRAVLRVAEAQPSPAQVATRRRAAG